MLSFRNKELHFDYQRCCHCGTCFAACTENALRTDLYLDGTFQIHCDVKSCTRCGKCVSVCPSNDLPDTFLTEQSWRDCRSFWLGHASDHDVCYSASSGGVARTLVASSLESKFCDQAYCLVKASEHPWAEGKYLSKGDDVLHSLSNSMYFPIPVNRNLKCDLNSGTLLVVGTNCQLLAAEKFYRGTGVSLIKIAILCKQQKTNHFTDFIYRRLKAQKGALVKYRGGGWPGVVSVGDNKLPYDDAAALPFGKRIWRIPGCLYCGNPLGSNADLTLADPWGVWVNSKAEGGRTLIMVHTKIGEELLQNSRRSLKIEPLEISDVKRSVGWIEIKKEQDRIRWRQGQVKSPLKRCVYYLGDLQRRLYEIILDRFTPYRIFLKILSHVPFLG